MRPKIYQTPKRYSVIKSRLTEAYGKIGSNLNQIARYLNEGSPPCQGLAAELRGAVADLAALKFDPHDATDNGLTADKAQE